MNRLFFKFIVLFSAVGFVCTQLQCNFPGESNGSGIGNGMITGKLYEPDGVTPAGGADVVVWESDAVASVDSSGEILLPTAILQTQTDENGDYSIDRIDPGTYVIEAVGDNENMARIDSIAVESAETSLELTDTLKAPGAIKGIVAFENDTQKVEVKIFCRGSNGNTSLDSSGMFIHGPLAEGMYSVVILPWNDEYGYGSVQKENVLVTSQDTVDIGTISLKMGVFSVANIEIDYDSSSHIVRVSWQSTFAAIGYNIYRRKEGDSAFGLPINGSILIKDTMFIDSSIPIGQSYQYAVAAVSASLEVGPLSAIVSVSSFKRKMQLDTIKLIDSGVDNIYSFIKSKDEGCLYMSAGYTDTLLDSRLNVIQKYSNKGELVGAWNLPFPTVIDNNRMFYANQGDFSDTIENIICIDSNGTEKIVSSFISGTLKGFDVAGNSLVMVNKLDGDSTQYVVNKIMIDKGDVVFSRNVSIIVEDFFKDVILGNDGVFRLVWVTHILEFDDAGNKTGSFELPPSAANMKTGFSHNGYIVQNRLLSEPGIVEFIIYAFNGVEQYRGEFECYNVPQFYLSLEGDIYIHEFDSETHKTNLYRLPDPFTAP